MHSPEMAIFRKETGALFSARSTLSLWLLSSFLIGYGFIQAVDLYSEASRAALAHKELNSGMNPFEGILVPTLGALYLITTLLFPFVAIRTISSEKQTGTLKLLLQLPVPFSRVFLIKGCVVIFGWFISTLPALLAVALWLALGGHVTFSELFSLIAGHALYAFAIIGVSFLIAALTQSSSSAALFVLSVTLGSWILDFSVSSQSSAFAKSLSFLSLTAAIRPFERALMLSQSVLRFLLIGASTGLVAFLLLAKPAASILRRAKTITVIVAASVLLPILASFAPLYVDLSEDRRNSFSKEQEAWLLRIPEKLVVRVSLSPDDPRYKDLQRNVLSKLERVIPDVSVSLVTTGKSSLFGVGSDEGYGLNEYEYRGKVDTSRSTSPREILPLISNLVGLDAPEISASTYPGYPLVAEPKLFELFFYVVLPLCFLCLWWWHHRIPLTSGGNAQ